MHFWLRITLIAMSIFYAFCVQAEERDSTEIVTFQRSQFAERARVKRIILDLLGPEAPASVNTTELSSEAEANLRDVISAKIKTTK